MPESHALYLVKYYTDASGVWIVNSEVMALQQALAHKSSISAWFQGHSTMAMDDWGGWGTYKGVN